MRVLIVTADYLPNTGGVAVFNHGIAEGLAKAGHKVWVLAPAMPDQNNTNLPYRVIRYTITERLPNLWPTIITFYFSLIKKIDVILYGHAASTLSAGGILARKFNLSRLAVLFHGYDMVYTVSCNLDKRFLESLIRNADLIITNSSFTKDKVVKTYNDIAFKVKILNPGIWPDSICKAACRSSSISKDKIVILTVCRLVSGKGLDVLLDAFTIVERKLPTVMLEIVGEGPLMKGLSDKAEKLNIQGKVMFKGKLSPEDLFKAYNGCDVFVMPSEADAAGRFEGFGIVFLEANACGKAVIGTRHGGVPDAVQDGVTGILVEPGNVQQLAKAMLLLIENKELRNKMGLAGRRRVENHFTWAKVTKVLEKHLTEIL